MGVWVGMGYVCVSVYVYVYMCVCVCAPIVGEGCWLYSIAEDLSPEKQ